MARRVEQVDLEALGGEAPARGRDREAALTLVTQLIHDPRKLGALATTQASGTRVALDLVLVDVAAAVDQVARGGRLAAVDVADDDERDARLGGEVAQRLARHVVVREAGDLLLGRHVARVRRVAVVARRVVLGHLHLRQPIEQAEAVVVVLQRRHDVVVDLQQAKEVRRPTLPVVHAHRRRKVAPQTQQRLATIALRHVSEWHLRVALQSAHAKRAALALVLERHVLELVRVVGRRQPREERVGEADLGKGAVVEGGQRAHDRVLERRRSLKGRERALEVRDAVARNGEPHKEQPLRLRPVQVLGERQRGSMHQDLVQRVGHDLQVSRLGQELEDLVVARQQLGRHCCARRGRRAR